MAQFGPEATLDGRNRHSGAEHAAMLDPISRQNDIPKFLAVSLVGLLTIAGAISIPLIGTYGPIASTILLDTWLVAFLIVMGLKGRNYVPILTLALFGYMLGRVIPALVQGSPLEDFLQAYRWVLYLVIFAFAVGKRWRSARLLKSLTFILLGFALTKALATRIIDGPGERPGLLLENNFELALFAGLVAVSFTTMSRRQAFTAITMFGALTFLAGSRSGAVVFVVLAAYFVVRSKVSNLFVRYLLSFVVPAAGILSLVIFLSRNASSGIDRLNFFQVFLRETADWSIFEWLFGTTPITPLSPSACGTLSFYVNLFASTGDGTCYSVILHSFAMRVVFDSGLIGLLLAFGATLYLMIRGGVRPSLAACLLLIAAANSASVSGLNNPYVALPILLAITTARMHIGAVSDESTNARPRLVQAAPKLPPHPSR